MKKLITFIILGLLSMSFAAQAYAGDNDTPRPEGKLSAATTVNNELNTTPTPAGAAPGISVGSRSANGKWSFGGSVGMSFGNYTSVSISPQVGYMWNNIFALGLGLSYNYYDHKDRDYTLNYVGLNLSLRLFPIRYVHLYAQPEVYRRWGSVHGKDTEEKVFAALLLGGGLSLPVGPSSTMHITLYYDVIQDKYTPHGNKIGYSIGYTFNF